MVVSSWLVTTEHSLLTIVYCRIILRQLQKTDSNLWNDLKLWGNNALLSRHAFYTQKISLVRYSVDILIQRTSVCIDTSLLSGL